MGALQLIQDQRRQAMATPIAITISRQFGAGGAIVGRQIAQKLDFQYLDQEIVGRVAEKVRQEMQVLAGREERLSSLWETFLQVFSVGAPEAACPPPEISRYCSDRELFLLEGEVIQEVAARQDAVIVGRGGFRVLREHPGRISVFLYADRAIRAATIRDYYQLPSEREAMDLVDNFDRQRERFLRAMTGVDWLAAPNYHLCLDTGRIGMEAAGDLVIRLVKEVREQQA
jgi:CMP/dCMP kinase